MMDTEYITQLVLDEITGIITSEDSVILNKMLQEEPEAAILRDELYIKLTTGDMKGALDNLEQTMPIEEVFIRIRKQESRKLWKTVVSITIPSFLLGLAVMTLLLLFPSTQKQHSTCSHHDCSQTEKHLKPLQQLPILPHNNIKDQSRLFRPSDKDYKLVLSDNIEKPPHHTPSNKSDYSLDADSVIHIQ
jgi:hypothetical protein